MYPQNYDYQQNPTPDSSRKKFLILGGAGLLLFVVVVASISIFFSRPSGTQPETSNSDAVNNPGFTLTKTSFNRNDNFATLHGDAILSYNGLAFYKQPVDGSAPTVLLSGVKLPHASNIAWADDKGAFMNFDSGFGGTQPDTILRSQREAPSVTTNPYVWYVDFATGSVSLFSKSPLALMETAPKPDRSGVYYVGPVTTNSGKQQVTPLGVYDFASRSARILATNLNVASVEHITPCQNDRVCVIAVDNANNNTTKIFSFGNDGGKREVYSVNGRILETSNPSRFVVIENDHDDSSQAYVEHTGLGDDHEEGDTDLSEVRAKLYDIQSGQTTDLGFNATFNDLSILFTDENNFVAIDQSYNANKPTTTDVAEFDAGYRAGLLGQAETGLSKLFPLRFTNDDATKFNDPTIMASYGSSSMLLTGTSLKQYVLSKGTAKELEAADIATATAAVDSCIKSTGMIGKNYDAASMTFDIQVSYNASFSKSIKSVSTCISGKGKAALNGYNYTFTGIDPVNGRYAT